MSTPRSTWFRSGRFFDYANNVTDPQFEEYKEKLEKTVYWYDTASNALSYTPVTTLAVATLVGGLLQAGLGPVGPVLSIINLVVPITSSLIMAASKIAKDSNASEAKNLIETGVRSKFFDNPPVIPVATDDTKNKSEVDQTNQSLQKDALNHRLLGPG